MCVRRSLQHLHFNFNFAILAAARWPCRSNCLSNWPAARSFLPPASCLLPPPFLRVEAARPRPLAGNSQAFLSLPTLLLLLLPTLLPLINLHGQQICAAAVAPFVPLSPLLRRLVQRFSCSRLVGVCVCVWSTWNVCRLSNYLNLSVSLSPSPLSISLALLQLDPHLCAWFVVPVKHNMIM